MRLTQTTAAKRSSARRDAAIALTGAMVVVGGGLGGAGATPGTVAGVVVAAVPVLALALARWRRSRAPDAALARSLREWEITDDALIERRSRAGRTPIERAIPLRRIRGVRESGGSILIRTGWLRERRILSREYDGGDADAFAAILRGAVERARLLG